MISKRSLILGAGAAIITRRALALPPAPTSLRNPLAYPGGNPGINPAHLASGYIALSAVAAPNWFPRIDSTQDNINGTPNGSPTFSIDGNIGPVASFATNKFFSFYYSPVRSQPLITNGMTYAVILRAPASAPGADAHILGDSTNFTQRLKLYYPCIWKPQHSCGASQRSICKLIPNSLQRVTHISS